MFQRSEVLLINHGKVGWEAPTTLHIKAGALVDLALTFSRPLPGTQRESQGSFSPLTLEQRKHGQRMLLSQAALLTSRWEAGLSVLVRGWGGVLMPKP